MIKPKKHYTAKDYKWVLGKILESWSSGISPDEKRILHELKSFKSVMDREYEFFKEMK